MASKKVTATFLVDEERLLSFYNEQEDNETDNFHDALSSEFGWLEESGISMLDWKVEKGEC
jgi:hypothetical protein